MSASLSRLIFRQISSPTSTSNSKTLDFCTTLLQRLSPLASSGAKRAIPTMEPLRFYSKIGRAGSRFRTLRGIGYLPANRQRGRHQYRRPLARWTNDVYRSTPHRVQVRPADAANGRLSIAFFSDPDPDVLIETLPSTISEHNPTKYAPISASDHILERIAATN